MGLVYPDLPTVGQPNSTEQPKVRQSLIDLRDTINGSIAAANLTSDAVSTVKIADSAVSTAKVADSAVSTAKVADSAVTTAKIADSNVTLAKMADSSVGAAEIVDDSVGISELNPAYIQGYTVTATDAAGSVTMTWPTAFASAFYVVAATAKVSANTTANVVVSAQTTTTVTFGWSGGPSGSWTIQAIGIHL